MSHTSELQSAGAADASFALKIVDNVAEGAAGEVGSWIMGKLLEAIFGDGDTQEILDDLDTIKENQVLILKKLSQLSTEIAWSTLEEEKFQAATRIQNSFEDFLSIPKLSSASDKKAKTQELVTGVLDLNTGIELALTQIDDLVRGNAAIQKGPGMIELAMQTALGKTRDNPDSYFLIDAYDAVRTFLSAVYTLQCQGTILIYNCYLQKGEAGLAQAALDKLNTRLKAQNTQIQHLTPLAMNFVAHMRANPGPVRTRITSDCAKGKGLQYNNVEMENKREGLTFEDIGTTDEFYFIITAATPAHREFMFHPVANTANDKVFMSTYDFADKKHPIAPAMLEWWAGVSQPDARRSFAFVPCEYVIDTQMLTYKPDDEVAAWTYVPGKTQGRHPTPAQVGNGPVKDVTGCHFRFDGMAPPPMFP